MAGASLASVALGVAAAADDGTLARGAPAIDAVTVTGVARDGAYLESLARRVAGAEYGPGAVARVEAALLATGIAAGVEASYVDGILRIIVEEAPLVSAIHLSCATPCPLPAKEWRAGLVRGRRLKREELEGAVAAIARQLRAIGYRDARVDLTTISVPPAGGMPRVDVAIAVAAGEGERVTALEVEPANRTRIVARLASAELGVGKVLDRGRLRRALDGEREALVDEGEVGPRLTASVERGAGRVVLVVEVTHGPKLDVAVDGDVVSDRRRRRLVEDAPPQPQLAAELVAERVADELESDGYWGSRATAVLAGNQIAVAVERGPRLRIAGVFANLPAGLDGAVAGLATRPSGYGLAEGYRRERLSRRNLAKDRRRLEELLVLEGYPKARVQEPEIRITGAKADVHFPVRPGKRVVAIVVESEGWPTGLAMPPLGTRAGGGFSEARVEEDRARLEQRLRDEGYIDARVAARVQVASALERAVTLAVSAGARVHVAGVAVAGAGWLSPDEIEELAGLEHLETMTRERLDEAERDVGVAPILSGAAVAPLEEGDAARPGERAATVEVQESPRYRFRYGVGYNSEEGPRGTLGFTDLAFLRGPRSLSLLLRGGGHDRRMELSLEDPQGFVAGRPLTVTGFFGRERREGFDLDKRGALVAFGLLGRRTGADALTLRLLRKELELLEVEISEAEIPRDERELSLLEISLDLVVDRTDDPLSPGRGFRGKAVLERALPQLDATADFVKSHGELSGYLPVARGIVLAGTLRAGWGTALGDEEEIPISERYFLGGTTAMRAFGRDRVGPRDAASGEPLGGEAFHHESLELRIPIVGQLGGSLFYERGDVFADRHDLGGLEARSDWGVGLRYRTAAGPVRVEYAREVSGDEDRIVLSLGEAF